MCLMAKSNNSIRQISQNDNSEMQYQPRDGQISIREILANALENASTSADEIAL